MSYLLSFSSSPDTRAFRVPEFIALAQLFKVKYQLADLLPPWDSFSAFSPPTVPLSIDDFISTVGEDGGAAAMAESFMTKFGTGGVEEGKKRSTHGSGPFALVDLENGAEDAKKIASRAVLLNTISFVHAKGSSVEEVVSKLCTEGSPERERLAPLLHTKRFKYTVESSERKISQTEKNGIVREFERVGLTGVVDLREPEVIFRIVMQHEPKTRELVNVFHVVEVATSSRSQRMDCYALPRRPYIGTTSMPPELTFLMANMAHVREGSVVYDPFCGTGSSLVSAAALGALTLGTDMDGRAMRAGSVKSQNSKLQLQQQAVAMKHHDVERLKTQPTAGARFDVEEVGANPEFSNMRNSVAMDGPPSMLTNFHAYGLPHWPERVRLNFSLFGRLWRPLVHAGSGTAGSDGFLDGIMSDPPYGLREQKKKVETREGDGAQAEDEAKKLDADDYGVSEMVLDLVMFAAQSLAVGGRLTFWHPTTHNFTTDELPRHPSMHLCSCVAQQVSLKLVRVLVTLVKVSQPPLDLSKDSCRPPRNPDNVRKLLDETKVEGNDAYNAYRAKREKKYEEMEAYRASPTDAKDKKRVRKEQNEAKLSEGVSKRQLRREKAAEMVEQRAVNLEKQQLRHRLSQLANKKDEELNDAELNEREAALARLKQIES